MARATLLLPLLLCLWWPQLACAAAPSSSNDANTTTAAPDGSALLNQLVRTLGQVASLPDYVVLTPSLHKNGGLAHVTRAMDRALARLGREGQPEGKGETTASVCHVACPVEVFGDVGAHTVPAAAVFGPASPNASGSSTVVGEHFTGMPTAAGEHVHLPLQGTPRPSAPRHTIKQGRARDFDPPSFHERKARRWEQQELLLTEPPLAPPAVAQRRISSASKLFEIVNAEREALLDLYASTGGPSWTNRSGWATDTPACEWFGVTCRSDGIVARISLSLNGLKGPLPPSIGTFTHLESLDCNI